MEKKMIIRLTCAAVIAATLVGIAVGALYVGTSRNEENLAAKESCFGDPIIDYTPQVAVIEDRPAEEEVAVENSREDVAMNLGEASGETADENVGEIISEAASDRYAAYSRQLDLMEEQDGSSVWQHDGHYCTKYWLTGLSCAVLCDMAGNGEEQLITVSGSGDGEHMIKVWDFRNGQIVLLGEYPDGLTDTGFPCKEYLEIMRYQGKAYLGRGDLECISRYFTLDGMNDDWQMEDYGTIGVQHGVDLELGGIFEPYNDSKIFPELTVWDALEKADSIEKYLISYEVYRGDPLPPEEKQNEAEDKLRETKGYLKDHSVAFL